MLTFPSGKKYIGQTKHSFEHRFKQHVKKNHRCVALKAAIEKYGPESIISEILRTCDDEHLDTFEIMYIELYDSLAPNGYNLTTGGQGQIKFSDESIEKMKVSAKNRKYTKPRERTIGKEWNLPMYIKYCKTATSEGFTVRIPNTPIGTFTSKKLDMNEKLKLATDYYTLMKTRQFND